MYTWAQSRCLVGMKFKMRVHFKNQWNLKLIIYTMSQLLGNDSCVLESTCKQNNMLCVWNSSCAGDSEFSFTKARIFIDERQGNVDFSSDPVVMFMWHQSMLWVRVLLHLLQQSAAAAGQMENSPEERDREQCVVGQEGSQGCKRKRSSVETEADLNVNSTHHVTCLHEEP